MTGNAVVERWHPTGSSIGGIVVGKSKALTRRSQRKNWGLLVFVLVMIGPGWAQGSEPGQNPAQNSGQAAGKELPDAPGESKKKQSGNPVEFVTHKTKHELLRARDWESGWIAGEYVGRNRTLVTPDARAAGSDLFATDALITPEAYMKTDVCGGD